MENSLEKEYSGRKSLKSLMKNSLSLDYEFGEILWSNISKYFPAGFDKSILKLHLVLPKLKISDEYNNRKTSAFEINICKYDGVLFELYNKIKGLNGLCIEGIKIEVDGHNFGLSETRSGFIIIRFVKITEIIEVKPIFNVINSYSEIVNNTI